MAIPYHALRALDYVGAALRAAGLGRLSRLGRDWISRLVPGGTFVEIDGVRISAGLRDRAFLYRLKDGTFEPMTLSLFARETPPGAVVLDIGAYVGYYTFVAAQRVGPTGKVFSVEPDPASFAFLRRNVESARLANVVLVQKAASNAAGRRLLHRNSSDPSRTSLVDRAGSESAVTVDCITIDELVGDEDVDVVKIDVEGAEPLVLDGMAGLLARSHDLRLFVELNPSALKEAGDSCDALLARLRRFGFEVIAVLDEERDSHGERLLCNLYCRRRAKQ